MKILLNNIHTEITNGISISELLGVQQIQAERGVAIAINNTVIPKATWSEYILKENDKITVIRATQGG